MCGICGKIYFDPQENVNESLIRNMCESLQHRGPDESGHYVDKNVGLGHRRLSIIDLSTGQQPMCNSRNDIWIVFNGEIYNFQELREDLQQRGYTFLTASDTEVIIHLYNKYGTSCVNYLRGMFAFAIWDTRNQRLFLARDRVGQKPLFYTLQNNSLAFASEIKALLQDKTVKRALDLEAMYHYLTYQYVPPPATMFKHIYKLPPAHTLLCENGRITLNRYWDLRYVPKAQMNEEEIIERLLHLLQESVKLRMISDVPLGAFLSGGIDSSLVVAMMSQFSSQPVKTFSIGFKEKDFNELPYARLVAEQYQTDHQEFIVEPNAVDVLPKLVWHFDEPFGDYSAIPTFYVAKMTSQCVKVALNGDGGDESFAGYERYLGFKIVRYYCQLPHKIRAAFLAPLLHKFSEKAQYSHILAFLYPHLRRFKFLNDLSLETPQYLYTRTMTIFQNNLKLELLSDDVRNRLERLNSLDYMLQYFYTTHADHFTDQMLYSDIMTYLPGDLLVKVDRMTMAHSLEGRSPFLDHKLMEFVATIPPQLKLHNTQLKFILKKIGKAYLPDKILFRKKQGFGVPLGKWFRHELHDMVYDICLSSNLIREGIFKKATVQRILQEHQNGTMDHRHHIWLLLNLELWFRMFIRNG
jgi:asparagine synthase (glutamine-hydrolysing)